MLLQNGLRLVRISNSTKQ